MEYWMYFVHTWQIDFGRVGTIHVQNLERTKEARKELLATLVFLKPNILSAE